MTRDQADAKMTRLIARYARGRISHKRYLAKVERLSRKWARLHARGEGA
jgi:hypothetical protein